MIVVVVPAFRVRDHILSVLEGMPARIDRIVVVEDACPDRSGDLVENWKTSRKDTRVKLIRHAENQGVGGAVVTGYRAALEMGADIVVKMDGDGQMDPSLLDRFIEPLVRGEADYTKGNRFYFVRGLKKMPGIRLFGNSVLSLMSKIMSGYWKVMDPTNGYTAVHAKALAALNLDRLSRRYFFESDMLYQLSLVRAVVLDVPMTARYGSEVSNLRISKVAIEFPLKYFSRFIKRVFYCYFLRDFNLGSIQIMAGILFNSVGFVFGGYHYWHSIETGIPATSGTVMLAALPLIMGFQSWLGAFQFDVINEPRLPLHKMT